MQMEAVGARVVGTEGRAREGMALAAVAMEEVVAAAATPAAQVATVDTPTSDRCTRRTSVLARLPESCCTGSSPSRRRA